MIRKRSFYDKLLLVAKRAFPGDQFKVFMKTGKVVEPALKAQLLDADAVVY